MPLPLVRSLSCTCRGCERSSREVDVNVNVNFAALVLCLVLPFIFLLEIDSRQQRRRRTLKRSKCCENISNGDAVHKLYSKLNVNYGCRLVFPSLHVAMEMHQIIVFYLLVIAVCAYNSTQGISLCWCQCIYVCIYRVV